SQLRRASAEAGHSAADTGPAGAEDSRRGGAARRPRRGGRGQEAAQVELRGGKARRRAGTCGGEEVRYPPCRQKRATRVGHPNVNVIREGSGAPASMSTRTPEKAARGNLDPENQARGDWA